MGSKEAWPGQSVPRLWPGLGHFSAGAVRSGLASATCGGGGSNEFDRLRPASKRVCGGLAEGGVTETPLKRFICVRPRTSASMHAAGHAAHTCPCAHRFYAIVFPIRLIRGSFRRSGLCGNTELLRPAKELLRCRRVGASLSALSAAREVLAHAPGRVRRTCGGSTKFARKFCRMLIRQKMPWLRPSMGSRWPRAGDFDRNLRDGSAPKGALNFESAELQLKRL